MQVDSHGFPMRDDPHLTGKGERIIGKGESMSDYISRQAAIDGEDSK